MDERIVYTARANHHDDLHLSFTKSFWMSMDEPGGCVHRLFDIFGNSVDSEAFKRPGEAYSRPRSASTSAIEGKLC